MIIGITGGSGSGKSRVSKVLYDKGFYIIDADLVARECVKKGKPSYNEIMKRFGEDVFLPCGELDRKKLGAIVFSDEKELEALNKITHKYIKKEIEKQIEENSDKDIVIDAAVLKQGGLWELCDIVVLVRAEKQVRIKRIMQRDTLSEENAKNRIESQPDDKEYMEYCDFVADNSGDFKPDEIADMILDFAESKR